MDRFRLGQSEAVVVLVDIQERLAAVMDQREKVLANCLHLISAASLLGLPVIVIEQYSKGLGPTLEEIRGALPSFRPIEKTAFDCCGEPAFLQTVGRSGRNKVILAGMEAHICVLQTCLGLMQAGFVVQPRAGRRMLPEQGKSPGRGRDGAAGRRGGDIHRDCALPASRKGRHGRIQDNLP